VVTVPFTADDAMCEYSAREHGVLWTPMSHFYTRGGLSQLRLAFSQLTTEQIDTGLDRLAALVRDVGDGPVSGGRGEAAQRGEGLAEPVT